MKKTIYQILFLSLLLFAAACKKNTGEYYHYQTMGEEFSGTTLDYLKSQSGIYDSMLVVIDLLPGMSDTINNSHTVFAVSNAGFINALKGLNNSRKAKEKDPVLSLEDLDIPLLDTMFCKYIINGVYSTNDLVDIGEDGLMAYGVKYNSMMNMTLINRDASGFEGGGEESIVFSDTNNSIYISSWQRSNARTVNIKTATGIVHPLEVSHEFGFAEFSLKFVDQ